MSTVLEPVTFNPAAFEKELNQFESLLRKPNLSETKDVLRFFKKKKHLTAYMGTFAPDIGPATELCYEFDFFGDFHADVLLGNLQATEFCVVEFEDGRDDSIFKKQPKRKHPEWSPRFEHAFSQLADWFYNPDDYKKTDGFKATFGHGHVRFIGLIVIGRDRALYETKRARLSWRTDKVLIDTHKVNCITFDQLHAVLRRRFQLYKEASKLE